MKIISTLEDKRIRSYNLLVEFKIGEYLEIAENILTNNPFQRRRVKASSTVYSLLRDDLKEGCIIPPIVLAITSEDRKFTIQDHSHVQDQEFMVFIKANINHVIILDGLQRTYNIIDANRELEEINDSIKLEYFHKNKI